MTREPVGTFALVLHSHLPWLAHHGRWPVGEEWLYQAWAHSYLPVVELLERLAAEGREDVLTLGVTPVLAAQLDDPHCLREVHGWIAGWRLRAHEVAPRLPGLASYEHRTATHALELFESRWRHGFSPVLRRLVDAGTVELLGGPATHPFAPLLQPDVRTFALDAGLSDTALRTGRRPHGIWAPECGYAPEMEREYAAAGVRRFLVDGPSLHGDTAFARPVGGSDVLAFGRDLETTYRVWSPRSGYPGSADYRDFHTWDHITGLKPARVTGKHVPAHEKAPYSSERATAAVARDAADFVSVVRSRLVELRERHGRPALTVAAFDTELFGHWWHEGPAWLEAVLRALPEAGVRVTTLRGAAEAGLVGEPVDLPASSWGSGKDWRVWAGDQVADVVALNDDVQKALLDAVPGNERHSRPEGVDEGAVRRAGRRPHARDPLLDALAGEALLALSSDWAFMVSKDSAAQYARERAHDHAHAVHELAGFLADGRRSAAEDLARRRPPQPFGHLDARGLARV